MTDGTHPSTHTPTSRVCIRVLFIRVVVVVVVHVGVCVVVVVIVAILALARAIINYLAFPFSFRFVK